MVTVVITVRDTESGRTAEHHVYNQDRPWTEAEDREWVGRTEYDPWVFAAVRAEYLVTLVGTECRRLAGRPVPDGVTVTPVPQGVEVRGPAAVIQEFCRP